MRSRSAKGLMVALLLGLGLGLGWLVDVVGEPARTSSVERKKHEHASLYIPSLAREHVPEAGVSSPRPPSLEAARSTSAGPAAARELSSAARDRRMREIVDRQVVRLGRAATLSQADRGAVLDALRQVRRSSGAARRIAPADHASQVEQTRALVDADRRVRELLGIGMAELLAAEAGAGQVEDLGATR